VTRYNGPIPSTQNPAATVGGPAEPWMRDARCRSFTPEQVDAMWFDDTQSGQGREKAKAVCNACPVVRECFELALDTIPAPAGVWGGVVISSYRGHNRRRSARAAFERARAGRP